MTRTEKTKAPRKSTRTSRGSTSRQADTSEIRERPGADSYATTLATISRAAHGSGPMRQVLGEIMDATIPIASSTHAVLFPIHSAGMALRKTSFPIASNGFSPEHLDALEHVFGDRIRAATGAEGSILGPDFLPGYGACHVLVVPLSGDADQHSALVLLRDGASEYAPGDLTEALAAVEHVSLAVRHARMEDDMRHRTHERALVARITQTVVAMQDLDSVLHEVASAALSISGWDACTVGLLSRDTDSVNIQAVARSSSEMIGVPQIGDRIRLLDWQNLRFALDNCAPYQLGLERGETLSEFERTYLVQFELAAVLAVPFVVNGDAVGVVQLYTTGQRALDARALRSIQDIGTNAALAIQHSQYAEQARQQAEEQSALLRVSQAVISGKDLHVILSEIARVSLGFDGVEACRVLLWHREADQFEIGAMQSIRDWQMLYQVSDRYPVTDWPTCRLVMQACSPRGFDVGDQDMTARERANHVADGIQSLYTFPIMIGDSAAGVLSLMSRSRRRMSAHAIRIGQELAAQAAHAIDRANLFGQLRRRAETDGLTGLLNHRAAFETLDRELAAARKLNESLSIIIIDLDDFKFFNDTHGHLTGDRVLVEVAAALRESCRSRDYVARYGGDEFLLILPGTGQEIASGVAERLLRRMEGASLRINSMELPVRISIGVATFPQDATNRQELIAYGDAAMYSAKECGGGQLGMVDKGTRSLEVTVFGALSGLVRAVDRKDRYTKDHSNLVAEYAARFGRYIHLSEEQIDALDVAGQLHDVGKIAVPDSVLRKPGRLSPEEEALIRQHVVFSELIIKGVPNLEFVLAAVGHHHERWDGLGYPYGKQGEDIPLLGRILAMADALAAMTHDRPYRKGRSIEQALVELRKGAGTQFDPNLVEEFVAAVSTSTALLREETRRKRLNPFDVDPDNPPDIVGLTDYLRQRREMRDVTDVQRDTA